MSSDRLQHGQLDVGNGGHPLVGGTGEQHPRDGGRQESLETPSYIEKQRLRRLYQALYTYKHTRSEFLLDWAENEVMHMVRDS
jgi:hypothetical protein